MVGYYGRRWPERKQGVVILIGSIFRSITTLGFIMISMTCAKAEPLRFVIVGDMPYNESQTLLFEDKIVPAISGGGFPFAIHVGDFKGGGSDCTNAGLARAYAVISQLIPDRVFYTPGDNDWTDCDRNKLSNPISELARLDRLRKVFFGQPLRLPGGWAYHRQEGFPENAMWRLGGLQFATLHVVGTANGRVEIKRDNKAVALAAVEARDQANSVWLRQAFGAAESAQALVVALQADITVARWSTPCSDKRRSKCDAFAALREQLRKGAAELGKPVLVAHGDTGRFCVDREFGGRRAPNLWRLNNGGDYVMDAAIVMAGDNATPFSFFRLRTGEPLETIC